MALVGFGVDSFVETASGAVVGWRLHVELSGRADEERAEVLERRAGPPLVEPPPCRAWSLSPVEISMVEQRRALLTSPSKVAQHLGLILTQIRSEARVHLYSGQLGFRPTEPLS